jgi:hypothetical protein
LLLLVVVVADSHPKDFLVVMVQLVVEPLVDLVRKVVEDGVQVLEELREQVVPHQDVVVTELLVHLV